MATVLITGANRGIGLALARRYAGRGDRVIGVCRHASDALVQTGVTHIIVLEGINAFPPAAVYRAIVLRPGGRLRRDPSVYASDLERRYAAHDFVAARVTASWDAERGVLTLRADEGLLQELQISALFVKGIHTHADGTKGHYHIQITASGVGELGMNSEAELFKKVPEVDLLDALRHTNDDNVVITIRGIGEMTPRNPNSKIRVKL